MIDLSEENQKQMDFVNICMKRIEEEIKKSMQ